MFEVCCEGLQYCLELHRPDLLLSGYRHEAKPGKWKNTFTELPSSLSESVGRAPVSPHEPGGAQFLRTKLDLCGAPFLRMGLDLCGEMELHMPASERERESYEDFDLSFRYSSVALWFGV